MNGYFNENGNAKDLRLSLLNIAQKLDCHKISFVNSKIIPVSKDAQDLLKEMSLSDFKEYGNKGNVAASDISKVLEMIVDNTATSGEVSLLVSDFIFCPTKEKSATSLGPQAEKSTITDIFKKKKMAVAIYRLEAQFNGTFFTGHFEIKNNAVTETNYPFNAPRPYYIWAIGDEKEIDWLIKNDKISDSRVSNTLCLTTGGKQIDYHLEQIKGLYDIDRKDPKHAVSARTDKSGKFFVNIIASLGKLPLTEEYLSNPDNYRTNDNNYKVSKIDKTGDSYRIKVEGKIIKGGTYEVYLKIKAPDWVRNVEMYPEWDIRKQGYENCTYGFQYLVEGVCDAMTKESDNYAVFNIKIN